MSTITFDSCDLRPHKVDSKPRLLTACSWHLCAMVVSSRFAIPLGAKQIQMCWIVAMLGFCAIWAMSSLRVSLKRALALSLVSIVVSAETLLFHDTFSLLSLFYLLGIYLPLGICLPDVEMDDVRRIWHSFVALTCIMGICGLVQIFGQIIKPGMFVDPIQWLPAQYRLSGFMTTGAVDIGPLHLLRPNGMLALEPSFLSQFVALGLIGEVTYFRRPLIVALLAVSLVASLSGTGLLIALVALPFALHSSKLWSVVAVTALVLAGTASPIGSYYSQRSGELGKSGQSAHSRFVAPYEVMDEVWRQSPSALLFGIGSGQSTVLHAESDINYPNIAKVSIEYGLIGLLAFFVLWFSMFVGLAIEPGLLVGLLVFYFVASGALLHPPTVFPLWSLSLGFATRVR